MEETRKQRVDREMVEMLNELRVALPGVQVLFGFLLIVPFNNRWTQLSPGDHRVYLAALMLAATSAALLIAPSAHHRLRFRDAVKERILRAATAFAIAGLACLAGTMAACIFLATDLVYHSALASAFAGVFGGGVGVLWFVVPWFYSNVRDEV